MGKKASPAEELLLFDVDRPEGPPDGERKSVRCSECGRPLRAKRSVESGVSQACAAKVGRAVLTTVRGTRRRPAP